MAFYFRDSMWDCLHGLLPAPFLLSYSVFDFHFFLIFRFWPLTSAFEHTLIYRIVSYGGTTNIRAVDE